MMIYCCVKFQNAMQQQMAMAMGGGGPRMPSAIGYMDLKYPKFASRIRCDMMNNEISLSINRKVTDALQLGARIVANYDSRKSMVEFGGKYEYRQKNKKTHSHSHVLEAMYNKDGNMLQLYYTHGITDNCALTSRLMWSPLSADKIMTSFGYRVKKIHAFFFAFVFFWLFFLRKFAIVCCLHGYPLDSLRIVSFFFERNQTTK